MGRISNPEGIRAGWTKEGTWAKNFGNKFLAVKILRVQETTGLLTACRSSGKKGGSEKQETCNQYITKKPSTTTECDFSMHKHQRYCRRATIARTFSSKTQQCLSASVPHNSLPNWFKWQHFFMWLWTTPISHLKNDVTQLGWRHRFHKSIAQFQFLYLSQVSISNLCLYADVWQWSCKRKKSDVTI